MKLKVIKYRLYPELNPTDYAVGFNVQTSNGRSFYAHTLVNLDSLDENKTDEEIVELAYQQLEDHISARAAELVYSPSIENLEINIDSDYEVKAVQIDDRVTDLEETMDTLLGGEDDE